jgi:hypothetical protein
MFDKATRQKIRFTTPSGQLSAEELWDLPLTSAKSANLDSIAIQLDKELKETSTVSFVNKTAKGSELTRLKFDVVLHIMEVRTAEAEAATLTKANAERKQKLLSILAEKQDADLKGKSTEELQKLIETL